MMALMALLYFGAFSGILSSATGAVAGFILDTVNLIPFENLVSEEGLYKIFMSM